jgi:hypothetical protein
MIKFDADILDEATVAGITETASHTTSRGLYQDDELSNRKGHKLTVLWLSNDAAIVRDHATGEKLTGMIEDIKAAGYRA